MPNKIYYCFSCVWGWTDSAGQLLLKILHVVTIRFKSDWCLLEASQLPSLKPCLVRVIPVSAVNLNTWLHGKILAYMTMCFIQSELFRDQGRSHNAFSVSLYRWLQSVIIKKQTNKKEFRICLNLSFREIREM